MHTLFDSKYVRAIHLMGYTQNLTAIGRTTFQIQAMLETFSGRIEVRLSVDGPLRMLTKSPTPYDEKERLPKEPKPSFLKHGGGHIDNLKMLTTDLSVLKLWLISLFKPAAPKTVLPERKMSEEPKKTEELQPTVPMSWPKVQIEELTQEEYHALMSDNIALHAADLCAMLLKVKCILRSLQHEGVLLPQHTIFGETMCNEFIKSVKQVAPTPETLVNADVIIGRLMGYTVKSGMTPGSVVSFERRRANEGLH